jgi:hypothetical protein
MERSAQSTKINSANTWAGTNISRSLCTNAAAQQWKLPRGNGWQHCRRKQPRSTIHKSRSIVSIKDRSLWKGCTNVHSPLTLNKVHSHLTPQEDKYLRSLKTGIEKRNVESSFYGLETPQRADKSKADRRRRNLIYLFYRHNKCLRFPIVSYLSIFHLGFKQKRKTKFLHAETEQTRPKDGVLPNPKCAQMLIMI